MGRDEYSEKSRRGVTAGNPNNIMERLLPKAEEKTIEVYQRDVFKDELIAALQNADGSLSQAASRRGVSAEDFLSEVQKYDLTRLIKRENS